MSPLRPPPGPRSLAGSISQLTRPVLRRRGFAHADVLTRWPMVVGETLAACCCPERLSFPPGASGGATLVVRVASGFAPQLQHLAPLVMERINTFYGYRAVAQIRLVQGPLPPAKRTRPRQPRPLEPEEEAAIAGAVAGTSDPDLRSALMDLGRALAAARPARRKGEDT